MKNKIIYSAIAIVLLLSSFSFGAYAAVKYSLFINGKLSKADIKIINGTPYIPLPAISGLKGIIVKQDAKKGTVRIDDVPAIQPEVPIQHNGNNGNGNSADKPAENGFSRKSPVQSGTTLQFATSGGSENYTGEMRVEEVVRGSAANKMVADANSFNNAAPSGYEYLLAKIYVKVIKNEKESSIDFNSVRFTLVSGDGKDYEKTYVVDPSPSIDSKLYESGSNTGWASFLVRTDDTSPVITFGRAYDGTGGLWFDAKSSNTTPPVTSTTAPEQINQTLTSNGNQNATIPSTSTLSSKAELQNLLQSKFSTLQTSLGPTSFTFEVVENTTTLFPYDYWIMVKYDSQFFSDLQYSNKITSEQRETVKQELHNHIETLGKSVIAAMPNKKFYGNYFDSWYRYPNIKVDLITRKYYTWQNFDGSFISSYDQTTPSAFRWEPTIDDKL